MANIRENFRSYCEKKQNIKFPEQPTPVKEKKSQKEYMRDYYLKNKSVIQTYQRCWYEQNKERLANKLTKFQTLVYNYYLQATRDWLIPPLKDTAIFLWKTTAQIFRTTESLVKKWKLTRVAEWYRIVDWLPPVVAEPLFDSNEPDLYEDAASSPDDKDRYIKELETKNWELNRRLKNAEDRYLKLLWEYTDYKNSVETAYINYEVAEKVRNDMMKELYQIIMNR